MSESKVFGILLVVLGINTLLLLGVIFNFSSIQSFLSTGKRYASCDGARHETEFHDVKLIEECKE